MGCNCEADLMKAKQDAAELATERDGLLAIVEALMGVVTPEQFGEARRRLASKDQGSLPG
jgi:hypothetical protein